MYKIGFILFIFFFFFLGHTTAYGCSQLGVESKL